MLCTCLGFRACRKGGVAVEFALMVPILVFTMIAMVDFVRLMSEDGRIANAALAGAHFGMQSTAHAADEEGMVRAARADAGKGAEELEIVAEQKCLCANGSAVLCSLSCENGAKPVMLVKVSISKQFATMMPYPMIENPVPLYRDAEVQVQ